MCLIRSTLKCDYTISILKIIYCFIHFFFFEKFTTIIMSRGVIFLREERRRKKSVQLGGLRVGKLYCCTRIRRV